jgi:hypothetical protein
MSVIAEEFDPNHQLPSLESDSRFQRNTLVPICCLPVEILIIILHYIQDACDCYHHSSFLVAFNFKWTRVMLVCQHFRAVAVQTPTLWSVIDLECAQKWRDLCLERTQGHTPLQIRDYGGVTRKNVLYLHRAQSAVLRGGLTEVLCAPDLKLQTLFVSCGTMDGGQGLAVSSSTFGGRNPFLRNLWLRGYAVSLLKDAPAMPHLRNLKLERITADLTALARLWSGTPRLEHLYMRHLMFSAGTRIADESELSYEPDWIEPVLDKVSLPHLKTLHIEEELVPMSALVRMLPTPSAMLWLQLREWDCRYHHRFMALGGNHAAIYAACLPFLSPLLDQAHSQGGSHVRYAASYDTDGSQRGGRFHLESPAGCTTTNPRTNHVEAALSFNFSCAIDRPHPLLDAMQTLHLKSSTEGQEDTIVCDPVAADSFATLTNLHTLIVEMPLAGVDWIRNWVISRRGQIEEVQLAHSFTPLQIATLAEDLLKEGLTPTISQLLPAPPSYACCWDSQ